MSEGGLSEVMQGFLDRVTLKSLTNEDRDNLEEVITSDEIREALFSIVWGRGEGSWAGWIFHCIFQGFPSQVN